MVGTEGSTGHLHVWICCAGHETKSLDNRFSKQEESLVPALLGKILEEIVSVLLDTVGVEIDVDGTSDRVTVLTWQSKGIIRNRNN